MQKYIGSPRPNYYGSRNRMPWPWGKMIYMQRSLIFGYQTPTAPRVSNLGQNSSSASRFQLVLPPTWSSLGSFIFIDGQQQAAVWLHYTTLILIFQLSNCAPNPDACGHGQRLGSCLVGGTRFEPAPHRNRVGAAVNWL